jgi:large subunit ribosomal protein L31
MKANLHPEYHSDAVITCACGNVIITGSTKRAIEAVVCSNCHPFYTGAQTFVDTQGRIEKFKAKQKNARPSVRKARVSAPQAEIESRSLKDMLSNK